MNKETTIKPGSIEQAQDELSFWLFGGDTPPFRLVRQVLFNNSKLWTDAKVWGFTDPAIRLRLFDAISKEVINKPWISDSVVDIEKRRDFYNEFLKAVENWRADNR